MTPKLVLLNGAPGSGKSTVAGVLVDECPLALLLDIDSLRARLGQWSHDPTAAGLAARRLALAMIDTHLKTGLDVLVPQFLFRLPFVLQLEQVASGADANFVEIVLVSSPAEAAKRFEARAVSPDPNHQSAAFLQQVPGAKPIEELYDAMIEMLRERPNTRFVNSIPGDIEGTCAAVRTAITAASNDDRVVRTQ